uniref:Putative membrane protein n=1 Tax=Anopheles darlingi TaxID=43151 RepID=A0A2M4D5R9_ANODA
MRCVVRWFAVLLCVWFFFLLLHPTCCFANACGLPSCRIFLSTYSTLPLPWVPGFCFFLLHFKLIFLILLFLLHLLRFCRLSFGLFGCPFVL